jgi:xanthine dehydrogenase accessory factor
MDGSTLALLDALSALIRRGERGALATVVRAAGSTPQQVGARMLLLGDGRLVGTVGGGRIEEQVREALGGCLRGEPARTLGWDLTRDLGMCCGGRMEVFVEPIVGSARLIMFGAGHVAQATARLAALLNFRVTVVDEREELNSAERFPEATRLCAAPDEALRELAPSADDWLLVVTHDHTLDQAALEAALAHPHRYIGMIGSRRKVLRIYERMRQRRGALELSRVYAPVGLDIGAVGPEEIAVSVAAELVALRRGVAAPHLRVADGEPRSLEERVR